MPSAPDADLRYPRPPWRICTASALAAGSSRTKINVREIVAQPGDLLQKPFSSRSLLRDIHELPASG